MLGIIKKELYTSTNSILIYIGLGFIFCFSGILQGNEGILGNLTILIVYGIVNKNEYYEDKNRGYLLIKTLPLKRYKIVIAKFITAFILGLLSTIYCIFLILLFAKQGLNNIAINALLSSWGLSLLSVGIIYILIYKLGMAKAMNISKISFIAVISFPIMIQTMSKKMNSEATLNMFNNIFNNLNGLVIFITSLIVYILLMLISIRIFLKTKALD